MAVPPSVKRLLQTTISLPLLRPKLFGSGALKHKVNGVLLFGPPGVGKTMIAKALAKESGIHFLNVKPSDIISRYVGENYLQKYALSKISCHFKII